MTEPIMFHGGLQQQTKSGKSVWITHRCGLTKRYHGLYLNRNGIWVATSWDKEGKWQGFESSMDIKLTQKADNR